MVARYLYTKQTSLKELKAKALKLLAGMGQETVILALQIMPQTTSEKRFQNIPRVVNQKR